MSKIEWFELPAKDTQRALGYYRELLGWQFEPYGDDADYQVAGEAGGAVHAANGHTGALVYFGTEDIAAAVTQVRDLGGAADDPVEMPGIGFSAQCTDTEGNRFGLYQGLVATA